jgi:polyisoprenoid-binding protein YceI
MSDHAPDLELLDHEAQPLPTGRWRVVPGLSGATFSARGVWGAARANGTLTGLSGDATFHTDGRVDGRLTIPAHRLDSGNRRRDRHLKSSDFLDAERYPDITFTPRRISLRDGRYVLEGTLGVRDRELELALPVQVHDGQQVELSTEVVLERSALGLEHNPLGMIRGAVLVRVLVVLERDQAE